MNAASSRSEWAVVRNWPSPPRSDQEGAISTHLYISLPPLFIYRSAPLSLSSSDWYPNKASALSVSILVCSCRYIFINQHLSICLASYLTLYVYVYGERKVKREREGERLIFIHLSIYPYLQLSIYRSIYRVLSASSPPAKNDIRQFLHCFATSEKHWAESRRSYENDRNTHKSICQLDRILTKSVQINCFFLFFGLFRRKGGPSLFFR